MKHSRENNDTSAQALALHKKCGGKIGTRTLARVTKETLRLFYTPGVGAVSSYLAKHPKDTGTYTSAGRMVAVVSDGSAVLGLGNIGPEGALPVMEGKALLFKEFGGVDAVPLVLATQDADEIVRIVQMVAPNFAGINLEDISAPRCFMIEERLKASLSIPVMHDDQHGTAIVVLAGLINAFKVVKKNLLRSRVAIVGAGSAGTAIAKLLVQHGVGDVVVVDRVGIIGAHRTDLSPDKKALCLITNREHRVGGVIEAVVGADAIVGVSGPGTFWTEHVRIMAQRPIVFALANPTPEITPEDAYAGGAIVVATGRSDYPNQINNALVFPGVFRGAIDHHVSAITDDMKLKVAKKLASLVAHPTAHKIIPTIFDRRVVKAVASAIT
jgi:malate dehydrogenase (oxaloacetate-decarboxylating)